MWAGSRKEQKQVGTGRRGPEGCQSVPNCHPDTRFTVALGPGCTGLPMQLGPQGQNRAGGGRGRRKPTRKRGCIRIIQVLRTFKSQSWAVEGRGVPGVLD